jgi:hypothetical protein
MTAASAPKVLARLKEVCDQVHKDAKDPDHRHNALLELKNLFCKPGRNGRIGDKADVLKELKDRTSFDECVKCVIEIADDSAQHAKTILQGTDTHARSQELNVKDMAASLYDPTLLHADCARFYLSVSSPTGLPHCIFTAAWPDTILTSYLNTFSDSWRQKTVELSLKLILDRSCYCPK